MEKKKEKILLVEDDISLRDMYQARLEMEGYKVTTALDGEEALNNTNLEKPDLILLDLMMPKISGMDFLDILKSTPLTKNIPVIILTALTTDKKKGEARGAEDYLVKSECKLEDVLKKIKEVLKKYNNKD